MTDVPQPHSPTTRSLQRISQALRLNPPSDWREFVYSVEIDKLLAQKALYGDEAEVREMAARVIGRIRSQTAVGEIATKQRAGVAGALQALALVRDEAPTLPPIVSSQGRLYAWLTNTRRRLSEQALYILWRFLLSMLGGALALGVYVWNALTGIGASLLIQQVWGRSVSLGLTVGLFVGFTTLFASELPDRLRGFWSWWARALVAGILAFAIVTFMWGAFSFLLLELSDPDWGIMAQAGIGASIGYVILSLFNLPGWVRAIINGLSLYIPLYLAWNQQWNEGYGGIIYFREYDQVFTWLIPMIIVIALFNNIQAIAADVRGLMASLRNR